MWQFNNLDGGFVRLVLQMRPALTMTDDQFFDFCQLNDDLRIERSAKGELIIRVPTGLLATASASPIGQLYLWAKDDGSGIALGSSAGLTLPNGAMRAPYASWTLRERLRGLTAEQKQKFLPFCPDFVAELVTFSDPLPIAQAKMDEYIANGARLGWLIDSAQKRIHVYRPDVAPQILGNPTALSADPELPGFVLDLAEIWEPLV